MTPIVFVVPASAKLSLTLDGFAQSQLWLVDHDLTAESLLVGPTEDRLFPTLNIRAKVHRRAGYVTSNIVLPMV